ncbi:SWI/SNF chromatin-remodeling complex subunit, partial [Rhizopus stolonifer]
MQPNLTQLQYQQLQIQQQQQRLASMMQQKQRTGQPWDEKQLLLQKQRLGMMRPTPMVPNRPRLSQPSVVPSTSPAKLPEAKTILVETEGQKRNLKQYQERDDIYQDTLNLQHKRHIELAQSKKRAIELASMERRTRMQHGPAAAFGPGYRGYANGKTGTQSRIRFPHEKKRKRESFRFSLEALKEQATKEETLVPIRIELEHEGYKLRDTFTWNLNGKITLSLVVIDVYLESLVTPEQFADVMCEDLRLPVSIFSDQIAKAIREQIDDYNLNASSMIKKEEEEHKQQQKELLDAIHQPEKLISYPQEEGIELRTVIKLDITVGNWELLDQFEWDIGCPKNSPEEFAAKLVKDLGLGGEF